MSNEYKEDAINAIKNVTYKNNRLNLLITFSYKSYNLIVTSIM